MESPDEIEPLQPWERFETESEPAFAAFQAYREQPMGERSLRRLSAALGKDVTLLARWSSAHGWVDRVTAWDLHQDRLRRKANETALIDMAERHAKMAMSVQTQILRRLQAFEPEELSPQDLIRWLSEATRLERESRGIPTRVELTGAAGGPVKLEPEVSPAFVADVLRRLGAAGDQPATEDTD